MSSQRVRVIQPQPVLLIGQRPLVQRDGHIRVVSLQPERHPQRISELPATGITTFGSLRQGPHAGHHPRPAEGRAAATSTAAAASTAARTAPPCPHPGEMAARRTATRTPRTPMRTHQCARRLAAPWICSGAAVNRRPQEVTCSCLAGRRQRTFRQPEIRQIHMIGPTGPRIHEHIGRFDITVHQPGGMSGIQGRGHRGDNRRGPRNGQRAHPVHERPTSPPGTYRIAMNRTPSASPASNTGMMCGSSTAAADRDSRMKRCRNASSVATAGARTLSATCRLSRSSWARNTTAMPPGRSAPPAGIRRSANRRRSRPRTRRLQVPRRPSHLQDPQALFCLFGPLPSGMAGADSPRRPATSQACLGTSESAPSCSSRATSGVWPV